MVDRLVEMMGEPLLDHCAIIEIKNIIPDRIKFTDLKFERKDRFLFLVNVDGGWFVHQNAGRTLTEKEISALNEYLKGIDGAASANSSGEMLQVSVPEVLWPTLDKITNIPGCRISPNLLQKDESIFVILEFIESANREVSDAVIEFVSQPLNIKKTLIYFGKDSEGSKFLTYFRPTGLKSNKFILARTVWDFDDKAATQENQGVFQNKGVFVPKYFSPDGSITMIARLENKEILGNAKYRLVDQTKNVSELTFNSHFMKDFYQNVIERYSGPIFYKLIVSDHKMNNFFVIEKEFSDQFFRAISRHWSMPYRAEHFNRIEQVEDLDSLL